MRKSLKEYRNTFLLNGFRPRICPPQMTTANTGNVHENLKNDLSASHAKHIRTTGQPPEVGPGNMVIGYKTPPNFFISNANSFSFLRPKVTYIYLEMPHYVCGARMMGNSIFP